MSRAAPANRFDEVWEALPADLRPPGLARRSALLRAHLRPGLNVLDLGCGEGTFAALAAAAGARPIGVDVSGVALGRARAAHPALDLRLAAEGEPLPLADGEVELVWCSEVLEHVADTARLMSEARRVLAPGGEILVTTPYHGRVKNVAIALGSFEAHADPLGDHLRFYTRRSLRGLLASFGFEEIHIAATGGPPLLRRSLTASARRAGWRPAA